jgi:flavin reductase (DIM6/NTAB) family NADH-FMN oxidoreductase RutF
VPRSDLRALDGRGTFAREITLGIDGQLFRAVVGSFPTGVTIVTMMGPDGAPRGLTSNAMCAVSLEPPLLLFCLDKRSTCLPVVLETKAFVVNFLAAGRGDLATRFASPVADRFAGTHHEPSTSAKGAPILVDDIVAHAECTLSQAIDAGDHYVLIGHIEEGSSNGGAPLMYLRRTYAAWPDEKPAPREEDIHG